MTRFALKVFTIALASFTTFSALTVPASDTARAATPALVSTVTVVPAQISASKRWTAMRWAKTQAGKPYFYGGVGPNSYDCSGLIMKAYQKVGKSLPHNTGAMLASGKLMRVSKTTVRWGDLVFFGSGHVELWGHWTNKAKTRGVTFGAHKSGTVISYRSFNSAYYGPTGYYRVK
jgi:cell wall-associated NlpC family hydrolase